MKKNILILCIITFSVLFANEIDDLKFAVGLYSDGNFKLAQTELEKYRDNYPGSSRLKDVEFLLANVYLEREEYTQAEKLFNQLYENNSIPAVKSGILVGLAQAEFYLNKDESAERRFSSFLKQFPQDFKRWIAHFYLGELAFKKNNYDKAEQFYKNALNIKNEARVLYALLKVALINEDQIEAEKYLSNIIDTKNKEYSDLAIISYLSYRLKKEDYTFIKDYNIRAISNKSSQYGNFLLIKAIALYQLNQYNNSLDLLKEFNTDSHLFYKAMNNMEIGKNNVAQDIFENLTKSSDSDIAVRSYFYSARLDDLPEAAIGKLNQFIMDYPGHKYMGEALYLLALNNFKLKQYEETENFLNKAMQHELDESIKEKTLFLRAETEFQKGDAESAFSDFNSYLTKYPSGLFRDEALYKTGFYLYSNKNYPDAFIKFDQLLLDYPDSPKVGMANFYLGEIFYLQKKFKQALVYYEAAIEGDTDENWVQLRIAQIYYYQKSYDRSETELLKVPEYPEFMYDKYLLEGNLRFAKKQYVDAISSYDAALEATTDKAEKEQVLNKKAWTLYQMNKFDESTAVYQQLAQLSGSGDYALKAAAAAFSDQEYVKAVELYEEFLETNSDRNMEIEASIGLANSYYNLKEYKSAYKNYAKLTVNDVDNNIKVSALNGMSWSASQEESLNFTGDMDKLISTNSNDSDKILFYTYKINYLIDQGDRDSVLKDIDNLIKLNPDDEVIFDMKLLTADILIEKQELDEADDIYENLAVAKTDAHLLARWAELKLLLNQNAEAVAKIRKASMLSRDEQIWNRMLEIEVAEMDNNFPNDYQRYKEFASTAGREKAQIEMVKWNITSGNFQEINTLINSLQNSKYNEIKAEGQYLKGYALYKQGKFDEAIPELLRVRYLYPELVEIRTQAEVVACHAYYDGGYEEEAKNLLDTIEQDLDAKTLKELGMKIYGAEE